MQIMVNVVDDDIAIVEMMTSLLRWHEFRHRVFRCAEDFVSLQNSATRSINFVSSNLLGEEMTQTLDRLRLSSMSSTIIMTHPGDAADRVIQATKASTNDVLEKPFTGDQVLSAIKQTLASPFLVVPRRSSNACDSHNRERAIDD